MAFTSLITVLISPWSGSFLPEYRTDTLSSSSVMYVSTSISNCNLSSVSDSLDAFWLKSSRAAVRLVSFLISAMLSPILSERLIHVFSKSPVASLSLTSRRALSFARMNGLSVLESIHSCPALNALIEMSGFSPFLNKRISSKVLRSDFLSSLFHLSKLSLFLSLLVSTRTFSLSLRNCFSVINPRFTRSCPYSSSISSLPS